jgi:hypothetical protein
LEYAAAGREFNISALGPHFAVDFGELHFGGVCDDRNDDHNVGGKDDDDDDDNNNNNNNIP